MRRRGGGGGGGRGGSLRRVRVLPRRVRRRLRLREFLPLAPSPLPVRRLRVRRGALVHGEPELLVLLLDPRGEHGRETPRRRRSAANAASEAAQNTSSVPLRFSFRSFSLIGVGAGGGFADSDAPGEGPAIPTGAAAFAPVDRRPGPSSSSSSQAASSSQASSSAQYAASETSTLGWIVGHLIPLTSGVNPRRRHNSLQKVSASISGPRAGSRRAPARAASSSSDRVFAHDESARDAWLVPGAARVAVVTRVAREDVLRAGGQHDVRAALLGGDGGRVADARARLRAFLGTRLVDASSRRLVGARSTALPLADDPHVPRFETSGLE